jgi:hypothetical protein
MLHTWYTTFDFHNFGQAVAEAINHALYTTDFDLVGSTIAEKINATIRFLAGIVEDLDWIEVGNSVATALNAAIRDLDVSRLASGVNALALGMISAIVTFIGDVDWSDIGFRIADMLNSIKWNEIISGAFGAAADILNAIVSTISTFASTFDFSEVGKSIASGINNFFSTFDFTTLGTGISNLAKGILDTINNILRDIDWGSVGVSIREMLSSIDWMGVATSLVGVIQNTLSAAEKLLEGIFGGFGATVSMLAMTAIGFMIAGPYGAIAGAGLVLANKLSEFVADLIGFGPQAIAAAEAELSAVQAELERMAKNTEQLEMQILASMGSWSGVAYGVAEAWGTASVEVIRYASDISKGTREMLTPFLNNADKARVALLNIFLDGKPVCESDTLEIAGYVKAMADESIDQLRTAKKLWTLSAD